MKQRRVPQPAISHQSNMASRPQFATPEHRRDKRPDKRKEPRMMCSQLVGVKWKDTGAHRQECLAVLEDISTSGACVQMERPLEIDTSVKVAYGGGHLSGKVRYCVFRSIGYFVGIEFDPGVRWSSTEFRPSHLVDVKELLDRCLRRSHPRAARKTASRPS
jgi:hypothetical protein